MGDLKLNQIQFPHNNNTYHIPSNLEKEYEYEDLIMTLTYHMVGSDKYENSNIEKNLLMYLSRDGLNFAKVGTIPLNLSELNIDGQPYDFSTIWYKDRWIIAYDYNYAVASGDIIRAAENLIQHRLPWEGENSSGGDNIGGNQIGFLVTKDFINFENYKLDVPVTNRIFQKVNGDVYRLKPTKNGFIEEEVPESIWSTINPENFWANMWAPELFINNDKLYISLTTGSWKTRFMNTIGQFRRAKDGLFIMEIEFDEENKVCTIKNNPIKIALPENDYINTAFRLLDCTYRYENNTYVFTGSDNNEYYLRYEDKTYYLQSQTGTTLQLNNDTNKGTWSFKKNPYTNDWYAGEDVTSKEDKPIYFSKRHWGTKKFVNHIDPFIIKVNNNYYLGIKDESNVYQNIYKLKGNFPNVAIDTNIPPYRFHELGEGISIIKFKNRYLAYSDQFARTLTANQYTEGGGNIVSLLCDQGEDVEPDLLKSWTTCARVNNEGNAWNRHFSAVALSAEVDTEARASIFNFMKLKGSNFGEQLEQNTTTTYYQRGQSELDCVLLVPNASYIVDRDMKITINSVDPFFLSQGDMCNFVLSTDRGSITFKYNDVKPPLYRDGNKKKLSYDPSKQIGYMSMPYWRAKEDLLFDMPYSTLQLKCLYKDFRNYNYMDAQFTGSGNTIPNREDCPRQTFLLIERPQAYQNKRVNLITDYYDPNFTVGTWDFLKQVEALSAEETIQSNTSLGFIIKSITATKNDDNSYTINGTIFSSKYIQFVEYDENNIKAIDSYISNNEGTSHLCYCFNLNENNAVFSCINTNNKKVIVVQGKETQQPDNTIIKRSFITNDSEFYLGDDRKRIITIDKLVMNPNTMYSVPEWNTVILTNLKSNLLMGEQCYFNLRDQGQSPTDTSKIIFDQSSAYNSSTNPTGVMHWYLSEDTSKPFRSLTIDKPQSIFPVYGISTNRCTLGTIDSYQRTQVTHIAGEGAEPQDLLYTYGVTGKPNTFLQKNHLYLISNTNLTLNRIHRGNLQIGDSCLFILNDNKSSITIDNNRNFQWANNIVETSFTLNKRYEGIRITLTDEWMYFVEKIISESGSDNITTIFDPPPLDKTLTQANSAADALVTGQEINNLKGKMGSLSQDLDQLTTIVSKYDSKLNTVKTLQNAVDELEETVDNISQANSVLIDMTLTKPNQAGEAQTIGTKFKALTNEIKTIKNTINGTTDANNLFNNRTTTLEQQVGKTYFVDGTYGNDNNNGTRLQTAFKTIDYALDQIRNTINNNATSSITLYIAQGTYYINPIILKDYSRDLNLEICGWHTNLYENSTREDFKRTILTSAINISNWTLKSNNNNNYIAYAPIDDENIAKTLQAYMDADAHEKKYQWIVQNGKNILVEPCRIGSSRGIGTPINQYFDFKQPIMPNVTTNYRYGFQQPGAICNLWHEDMGKLAIVPSETVCINTPGTWYFNNNTKQIFIHFIPQTALLQEQLNTISHGEAINDLLLKLSIPKLTFLTEDDSTQFEVIDSQDYIVVDPKNIPKHNIFSVKQSHLLEFEGFNSIKLSNLTLEYASQSCLYIKTCPNLNVNNCTFGYAGNQNGVFLDTIYNGTFYNCESKYNRVDGFGITGPGGVSFFKCSGHHNGDDGLSHHNKGCTGSVIGGSYYHNGKAGVASPSHYSNNEINGVETYENYSAGIYAIRGNVISTDTKDFPKLNVSNCYIHDETVGISSSLYSVDCWNCIFENNINNTKSDSTYPASISIHNFANKDLVSQSEQILFNTKPNILLLGDSVCAGYGASDYDKYYDKGDKKNQPIASDNNPKNFPLMIDLSNANSGTKIDTGKREASLATKSESWKGFRYLRDSINSWAARFKAYVEAAYPGSKVVNRGWAGATIWELKTALQDLIDYRIPITNGKEYDINHSDKYNYAIVQIGINSIFALSALNRIFDGEQKEWDPLEYKAAENLINFNMTQLPLYIKEIITTLLNNNIIPIIATNTPILPEDNAITLTYYYNAENDKYCLNYRDDYSTNNNAWDICHALELDYNEFKNKIMLNTWDDGRDNPYKFTPTYNTTTIPFGSEVIKSLLIQSCSEIGVKCYDIQGEINWFLVSNNHQLDNYLADPLHPNDYGFNLIFNIYKKLLNA